jgi:hypothetical protein
MAVPAMWPYVEDANFPGVQDSKQARGDVVRDAYRGGFSGSLSPSEHVAESFGSMEGAPTDEDNARTYDSAQRLAASRTAEPSADRSAGLVSTLGNVAATAAVPAALKVARAAPRAATAVLAALGVGEGASALDAAPKLTREQQRQIEMDKQRMEMEATSARQRGLDAAEANRLAQENQLKLDMERSRQTEDFKRQQESQHQALPFRDRYPLAAQVLSTGGMAAAAAMPYMIRGWKQGQTNALNRAWGNTASRAEQALLAGDLPQAKMLAPQLAAYAKQAGKLKPAEAGPITYGVSSLLPAEASNIPEEIDLLSGSPEAKHRAMETVMDPVRIPAALIQGATFAGIGGKLPVRSRLAPEAQSAGVVKAINAAARARKPRK